MAATRAHTILIAAMGGEGGGVLAGWIVAAAEAAGLALQSTSIPGVAQRTGATTYYIEIWPEPLPPGSPRPMMCLNPAPGQVDVMLASEFVEAGRAMANGYVTPDRTLLIASTHRVFAMSERTAMGDGRYDSERLFRAARECAARALLFDMDAAAQASGSLINAVMFGALAGSQGALPFDAAACEAAIQAEGKAVGSNLAGFRAGLAAARQGHSALQHASDAAPAGFDQAARDVLRLGIARLTDYQDTGYADLYLERLAPIQAAERAKGGDGSLTRETARHLAARMSFEDVIRVAQLKLKADRFQGIEREAGIAEGQVYAVVEYFKPGIEEIASLLPAGLANTVMAMAERRGWLGKVHWGMTIHSNRLSGWLRLRLLAALRPWRPRSHRFQAEQAQIAAWLALIAGAAARDLRLAREVAECARLIKGYGDTFRRGLGNYERIRAALIEPAVAGRLPADQAADAILQARTAALADPEGQALTDMLTSFAALAPLRQAAE